METNEIDYKKKKEGGHFDYFAEVKTDFDFDGYRNSIDAERKRIDDAMQQLERKRELIDGWWKSIDYYRDALTEAYDEIESRGEKIEELQRMLEDKEREYEILSGTAKNLLDAATDARNQKKELEMKLAEMKKISEVMAKKASEEAVLMALRTYANTSKRKTVDKRAFAKTSILEMANANGLTLPQEFAAAIESLDDERPELKMVVNGDFVQSKHVDNEVNNVASGATGVSVNKG